MTLFHSIWTLILFVTFILIVLWAWDSRRKEDFDRAARTPLDDDHINNPERSNG
jgi:cytochrome c oxidase cbb3-type subunit 4